MAFSSMVPLIPVLLNVRVRISNYGRKRAQNSESNIPGKTLKYNSRTTLFRKFGHVGRCAL